MENEGCRRKVHIDAKALRESRGWLQREAAEKLGISRAHLSAIEHGKRGISLGMMDAIIQVFGVSYEDFFRKDEAVRDGPIDSEKFGEKPIHYSGGRI